MNQARSTYKTDYVPYDWMQNNFTSDTEDFCSSENIDDCLRYISREFSALGYPSVYTSENVCAFAVNCDIVKLLNVTFELLGNCKDYAQAKEELECRNRCLLEDLKSVNRKNSQLKESLEQAERKYKSALEKERQSKERNKELTQLLKIEKDECKRLSSQMQQQKKTYQHEIRKSDNNMSQMKSRLNQMLTDKNPDKKIASITSPNLLQRNSNQRGKWKTGSVAQSNFEEMYKSVISSYEIRCQEMLKDISAYHACLEFIQSHIFEIISLLTVKGNESSMLLSTLSPLQAIWNGTNLQKNLKERFTYLLEKIKEVAFQRINCSTKKTDPSLKSKVLNSSESSEQVVIGETDLQCSEQGDLNSYVESEELASEREKLKKDKLELFATISFIEKEKADLEVCKLEVIKMALQKEVPETHWHQNINTIPSFSVIQTKDGITAVPSANQLRNCLSAPEQQFKSLTPLWKSEFPKENIGESTSKPALLTSQRASPPTATTTTAVAQKETVSEDSGLPNWAITAMSSLPLSAEAQSQEVETPFSDCVSNEELELSTISSSEEQNLLMLNSAMADIENRRKQVSS